MKHIRFFLLVAVLFLAACVPTIQSPTPTQTSTPVPAATQTPSPTPAIVPTPTQIGGGSGKLIFEYFKVAYEKAFPDLKGAANIFTSNLDGTHLTPITNGLKGINYIENISADGEMVLISTHPSLSADGDLYLIHLNSSASEQTKLGQGLSAYNGHRAMFLDSDRVVFIGSGDQGKGIYIVNIDGTDPHKIASYNANDTIIEAVNDKYVYWSQGENKTFKDSDGFIYSKGGFRALYWTNLDGSAQGKLESGGSQIVPGFYYDKYVFSRDGKMLAWIPAQTEPDCKFYGLYTKWITDGSYTQQAALPPEGNPYGDFGSAHGQTIDMVWVDSYVHRCFLVYVVSLYDLDNPNKIALMPPANLITGNFTFSREYTLTWDPDGSKLLLFNNGNDKYLSGNEMNHEPLLYYINLTDAEPKLIEYKHGLFSLALAQQIYMLNFSPDGRQIIFANYNQEPYISILNLDTMNYLEGFGRNITPDSKIQRIGRIYWLP